MEKRIMKRVSVRTLALMVELLLAVVAIQCLSSVRPVKASARWLAGNGPIHTSSPSEANDCAVEA